MATVTGSGAISVRGAMACCYCAPWDRDGTQLMLAELARLGMNTFVYGPAGDEHTGAAWREPYRGRAYEDLRATAVATREASVDLWWRVSPSAPLDPAAGIRFADPDDRSLLLERVRDVLAAGAVGVLLTFDDVEHGLFHEDDRTAFEANDHPAATAHALLAAELAEVVDAAGARLAVCPTRYWGVEPDPYLSALDARLPDGVPWCWTGPEVSSPHIDGPPGWCRPGGRPIWVWDNIAADDWDDLDPATAMPRPRRLLLDVAHGRSARVPTWADGYLVNCGSRPALAFPALRATARWLADPGAHEPDAAFATAIAELDDDEGSLALVAEYAGCSPQRSRRPHPLSVRCWQFLAANDSGRCDLGPALADDLDEAGRRLARAFGSDVSVVRAAGDFANATVRQLRVAGLAVLLLTAEAAGDVAGAAEHRQVMASEHHTLGNLHEFAVLDGGLIPLIETARGLAGPPMPPHDV